MIKNNKTNKKPFKDAYDEDMNYSSELEFEKVEFLEDHHDEMKSSDLFKDDKDFDYLYKELYTNATKDRRLIFKEGDLKNSYPIQDFHTFFMNRKNKMYKLGKYYYSDALGGNTSGSERLKVITFIDFTYLTQKDRDQLMELCLEYIYFQKQLVAKTIYEYEKLFEDYNYDNPPVIDPYNSYKLATNIYVENIFNAYEYIKIIYKVNREVYADSLKESE